MVVKTIDGCPRCGGTHVGLRFDAMDGEVGMANYWAKCPVRKSPILAKMELTVVEKWTGTNPDNGAGNDAVPG